MKNSVIRILIVLFGVSFLGIGCKTEKILSEDFDPSVLNGPIGISIVPASSIALVTNSNFRLDYASGSLSVIDLASDKIVPAATVPLPDFSGDIAVDPVTRKLLIPNRVDNSLIVLDYSIPGSGGMPIDISEPSLANSILGLNNEILMDENPFGIVLADPAGETPKIYVTSIKSGTVNVLSATDLTVIPHQNLDSYPLKNGIPLITSTSKEDITIYDGVGANRLALSPDKKLVFVTSSRSNYIFIINFFNDKIEGVIDLSKYASKSSGLRGIAISSSGILYVASRPLGGVLVLDVSGISVGSLSTGFVGEQFITFIPSGAGPEGLAINPSETKLYVCNEDESTVSVIDISKFSSIATVYVERGPTEIAINPMTDKAYVTNFLSNSVSVIDTVSDTVIGVIK